MATGWTIGVLGFDSWRGLGIFLSTTTFRTAPWPTQPAIQWVAGALSLGLKRPGHEADHSPPSSAEVKEWVELYLQSPNTPSWRGAQLKHRNNFTLYYYVLHDQVCQCQNSFATDCQSVSQSVSQAVRPAFLAGNPDGTHNQIMAVVKTFAVLLVVGRSPWREDGSII
jgi:hypothetical protein